VDGAVNVLAPLLGPLQAVASVETRPYLVALTLHTTRAIVILLMVLGILIAKQKDKDFLEKSKIGLYGLLFCTTAMSAEIFCLLFQIGLSPFAALRKLVPGLELTLLPWLIISPAFFISICFLIRSRIKLFIPSGILLILFFILESTEQIGFTELKAASSVAVKERNYVDRTRIVSLSPSKHLLKKEGDWVAKEEMSLNRNFQTLKLINRTRAAGFILTASTNSEHAPKALDSRKTSYWSTVRGQKSSDWLKVKLKRKNTISRAVLSVKRSPEHYPRGIKVTAKNEKGEEVTILEKPEWEGPVKWTQFGYPYYGQNSEVILDFLEPVYTGELTFYQTSNSESPWSVFEVKLYK